MVKKGPFLGPTSPPNCHVACPHATTSIIPNLNLALCSVHGQKKSFRGTHTFLLFSMNPPMGNPISPTLLLLCLGQWEIHHVWFCWPPDERKFKFQSQPINPTFPYTSNITLNPRKCLFKISITVGVLISEGWRDNLPFLLTTFQSCLLMYGNMDGTSRNNPFL